MFDRKKFFGRALKLAKLILWWSFVLLVMFSIVLVAFFLGWLTVYLVGGAAKLLLVIAFFFAVSGGLFAYFAGRPKQKKTEEGEKPQPSGEKKSQVPSWKTGILSFAVRLVLVLVVVGGSAIFLWPRLERLMEIQALSVRPPVQSFRAEPWQEVLIKGDTIVHGPYIAPGMTDTIWASASFVSLGRLPNGQIKPYIMLAGYSNWTCRDVADRFQLKNLPGSDSVVVRFKRVR